MTTATLTPVAGSAEEKAWIDVQAWFNKCITAAPKPELSQADLTIGHIIRWCQLWDIDTKDIEAICEKHGAYKAIRPFARPFPI